MKRIILIAAAVAALTSCSTNYYNAPEPPHCSDTTRHSDPIVIEVDESRDEHGNCKKSPYAKFYEEWELKEGWVEGMERVYDAWITKDHQYWVQTIKCMDAERHQYEVVNHQVDKDTYLKYSDRAKGYGCNKGMIFTN